ALDPAGPYRSAMVTEFAKRGRFMVDRLNMIPGVHCMMPCGAVYAFPHIGQLLGRESGGEPISSSTALAAYFLAEARVATVPGEAFGAPDHLRFSYATSMRNIADGLDRIEAAILRLS